MSNNSTEDIIGTLYDMVQDARSMPLAADKCILERDAQLIVPVMDYSIPTKECCDSPGCTEDPCEMFSRIPFPASQFTPKGCDCKKDSSVSRQAEDA